MDYEDRVTRLVGNLQTVAALDAGSEAALDSIIMEDLRAVLETPCNWALEAHVTPVLTRLGDKAARWAADPDPALKDDGVRCQVRCSCRGQHGEANARNISA